MHKRIDSEMRQWVPPGSSIATTHQLGMPSLFGHHSKWWPYLLAVAMTTATIGLRVIFTDWFDDRPLLVLFLLPITLSAYLGGLGPGLLATAIVTLGTFYIVLPPLTTFQLSKPIDLFQWLLMVTGGVLVCVFNEILLRARNRAEASEQLQALTLASIGDAVITTNLQGQITFMNREAVRLTGWPLNEAAGQPLLSVFRVFDRQTSLAVENLVETVLRATTPTRQAEPFCLLTREGQKISIEANSAPIKLANDVALGIVLVFRDNTERKRAEEQLRKSEERLRLTLAATNLGIWEWNLHNDSIYWSPECYKLFGQDSFGGTLAAFQQLVYPEDWAMGMAAALQAIATRTNLSAEFRILHPDGKLHWLANLGQTRYDEQGQPLLMIGTVHNITERKQAEEALRISEERFAVAFNASPEALAITTFNEGRFVLVNDAWVKVFGVSREAALGQQFQQLKIWLDDEQRNYVFNRVRETGAVVDFEITGQTIGGQTRQLLINAKLIKLGVETFVLSVSKDITERKQAENKLRESEEKFRLFIKHNPSAVAMFDREMRYLAASPRWSQDLNFQGEIIGRSHYELFPEIPEAWKEIHRRCLAGAVEKSEGDRFQRADGSAQWLRWEIAPWRDSAGQIGGIVIFGEDITARKEAEEALRTSEHHFRALFESASVGNVECDVRTGRYLRVNQKMCELTGYSAEELLARTFHEITHPEDQPSNILHYQQFTAQEIPGYAVEKRYIRKDGTSIWVSATPSLLLDEAGQPWRTIAAIQDITERKRAEAALSSSEQHFRALFDGAGVGNVECDAKTGRFLRVNQKMCEFTGYTAEELIGRQFSEITYPADQDSTLAEYQQFITQQIPTYAVEKRYVRKDGALVWVSVTSSLLRDEADQPWRTVAAIQDITERKRAEAALQLSEERLQLLHQIISNPYTDHTEKVNQLLRLGCQQFGLENGAVTKREPTHFEVTYVASAGNTVAPGLQCPVELTYCQETVRRNDLFELEHAGASDWRGHPAYATYGVETYFGMPVQCGNQTYGTLCFTSLTPRQTPFSSGDRDLLRLMTQWISAELTRQATAASLQESETRFRALFEQTPVGKAIVDLETQRIVDCNHVATTLLGYDKEELCALSISDVDMLHRPKEIEATLAALKRREKVQFETIYRRKDGKHRDVLVVGIGIQIHGKTFGYGSIIDITEKKQAEAALQQERERLEKIATSSPIVILSFRVGPDRVHAYPYVSPAFYELYGVTPQDLANDPRITDERVHPDDLPLLAESLAVSARTLSRWHHIWRVKHPDKGEIWVEGYGTPVPEPDGSVIWHGILNDVTERQHTENALRVEKERLEKMALASPIAMYSFNCTVEGVLSLRYASAAYYEILGLNHPGVTNDLSAMFARIPVEDTLRIRAAREESARTMAVLHETHRYQHPQKGERWIESYSAPVRESDGSLTWHGVVNDITERKQTEQNLLLTQNQLRHLATHLQSVREEERTAIAREIHDDLGQMLTAMRFNLKWIEQGIDPSATALRERVTNATDLISQTIQIVRRIATSLHPAILDDFGLPAALEWQVNEFQKHSGIRCHIEDLPAALPLERNRALALFRICQETLTNVARHAGATEISLSLREEQENVWLRIHDNGRGIALDALAKRRSLGLISMRERALSLGGEFTVQGAPGNGTTVTVRIPIPGEVQPALS